MTTISGISTYTTSLAKLQAGFKASDTDKNGALSKSEFEAASKANSGVLNGQSTVAAFQKLDGNRDGQISSAEITTGINLATQVQSVLLQGQEGIGSAYASLLNTGSNPTSSLFGSSNDYSSLTANIFGGGSASSSLTSILTGGNTNASVSSGLFGGLSASTNSLIQQLLSRYTDTANLS